MLVFSVTLTWSHVAVVLKDLIVETGIPLMEVNVTTVEPPNNGHIGDECFVHCSEAVPSSEVTCIRLLAGGTQFVHSREVVHSSECPLSVVIV